MGPDGRRPRIVIGSSMGGWIALLLARHLAKAGTSRQLAGLVLIAPAFDMTEALMWRAFPPAIREEIERNGVTYLPSAYGDAYPITKRLIEEGRSHLIEDRPFDPGARCASSKACAIPTCLGATRLPWSICCRAPMSSSR